jgi:AbrB family looped-hinge helix DNA binding protein
MSVAKVGKAGRMTIPAEVRRALRLQPGDSVRFIELEPGRFAIARVTVKDLRGMFGPARRRASIEEMHEAIGQHVAAEYARSTKAPATRRKKRRPSTKAATASPEEFDEPHRRPTELLAS